MPSTTSKKKLQAELSSEGDFLAKFYKNKKRNYLCFAKKEKTEQIIYVFLMKAYSS